ncbi:MAG TPA: PEP-CTERM sorting domain-containing protein [Albitalea sp.]|jgi:hypothetical protein|nr:PEP-CTERM sorting domain-containing protein [Albitalea sp.]
MKVSAILSSIAALCLAWFAGTAQAAASVSYSFSNYTDLQIVGVDGSVSPVSGGIPYLHAGERLQYSFDYTITLSDQGLPNAVIPYGGFYGPGSMGACCGAVGWIDIGGVHPGPREYMPLYGAEMAYIHIYTFDYCMAGGSCASWMNFGSDLTLMTADDYSPDLITATGTFTVFFSVSQDAGPGEFAAQLPEVAVNAVAFSVPEPGTWALMLAGGALTLWRARRRSDAQATR